MRNMRATSNSFKSVNRGQEERLLRQKTFRQTVVLIIVINENWAILPANNECEDSSF